MPDRASVDIDTDLGHNIWQAKPSGFLYTTDFRVGGGVFCHFHPLISSSPFFFGPFSFPLEAIQTSLLLIAASVDTLTPRRNLYPEGPGFESRKWNNIRRLFWFRFFIFFKSLTPPTLFATHQKPAGARNQVKPIYSTASSQMCFIFLSSLFCFKSPTPSPRRIPKPTRARTQSKSHSYINNKANPNTICPSIFLLYSLQKVVINRQRIR